MSDSVLLSVERDRGFWFHKMPSRGRGEYEVTGQQGDLVSRDLVDRTFVVEAAGRRIDTGLYLGTQGGKRRVRALDRAQGIQLQVAALSLLPPSTRDETSVSDALPILLSKRYIMDIGFTLTAMDSDSIVLTPHTLLARSGDIANSSVQEVVDFGSRLVRLRNLSARADDLDSELSGLILGWAALINRGVLDAAASKAVATLCEVLAERDLPYLPGSDPLPVLELLAGLTSVEPDIPFPGDTPSADSEVKLRSEHIYRQRRERGSSAGQFAKAVQAAYDFTCAFCGLRAPRVKGLLRAGVDAAHILPWGAYDLDVVTNGLMLCKQHHWAFDNHVLLLSASQGRYFIDLDRERVALLAGSETTVKLLESVTGQIDESRLPKKRDRPSPTYIETLYSVWE